MKKYEMLMNDTIVVNGRTLYRIRSLVDIYNGVLYPSGSLGGYIEGEHNLSHEGNCWLLTHGRAYGNASITGDSLVDYADIHGDAIISGYSYIDGTSEEYRSNIEGNTFIDNVHISINANIDAHFRHISIKGILIYPITFYIGKDEKVYVTFNGIVFTLDDFKVLYDPYILTSVRDKLYDVVYSYLYN